MASGETANLPISSKELERYIQIAYGTESEIDLVTCTRIGVGKGFASFITKVEIEWKRGDRKAPNAVVIKEPTYEKISKMPSLSDIFTYDLLRKLHNREISAYRYFQTFAEPVIPLAKLIHGSEMDEKHEGGILILEYVPGSSISFNDALPLKKARCLLKHIARMQAAVSKRDDFKEHIGKLEFNTFDKVKPGILASVEPIRELVGDRFTVTDAQIEAGLALVDKGTALIADPESEGYQVTMGLADLQPNNIIWKDDPDGTPSDEVAAFLDLQIAYRADYCCDPSRVLKAVSDRSMQDPLLWEYYEELSRACGGKAPVEFSEIEELWRIYRFFHATRILAMLPTMLEENNPFGVTKERALSMVDIVNQSFADAGL